MSVKRYSLISLISHIAYLLLAQVRKSSCFRAGRLFVINMRDIIIYVARWWEKCLLKRRLINILVYEVINLTIIWTLNRQVKILQLWDWRIYFESHMSFLCKEASQKLHAPSTITNYMELEKRRCTMKT